MIGKDVMGKKEENDLPHFVTSHDFHGDTEYVAWLQDMGESISREKLHQLGAELDFVDESANGGFGKWPYRAVAIKIGFMRS